MYAYHLCNVSYRLENEIGAVKRGSGGLWLAADSILIKTEKKWLYLPNSKIRCAEIERNNLKLFLTDRLKINITAKNVYMLNALYHYIEGVTWSGA